MRMNMILRALTLLLSLTLLASCAPKKEMVKEEPPAPAAAIENLVLPDVSVKVEPQPKPRKPEPIRVEQEKEEKYIILNFEGASIDTVIASFGELLDINYILTPGISGNVTIQSYKKFPVRDLFRIFQTILEINGITAVKDGDFYRIVPIDTAKMQPLDIEKGKGLSMRLDEGFVTQLIPLEYVKAGEAANVLRSLAPRGTDIVVYEPSNMLIVTALPYTLGKFMKLLDAIDISEADRESIKTFVYYVENGEAKKLADILKTLYADKKGTARPAVAATTVARGAVPAVTASIEGLPGAIGDITITSYEDINAMIVQCSTRSYLALLEVLKKIDVPAKQVLIEVLIAEVSLGDDFRFGLEWLVKTRSGDTIGFTTSGSSTPPTIVSGQPSGFAGVVSDSINSALVNYVFGALSQTSRLNVLASPHILALDNKEANIHIGSETPIATGLTTQPGTATPGIVTSGQIQYKTVGTILTVKPHITEKDRVTLDISQEVSDIGSQTVKVAGQDFASFDTRKVKTTAVVQSGHTLILGGLIREAKSQARAGIPWLSKIPILGYLFSSTTDRKSKTELLLMVTPHVISDQNDADAITRDFQNRVKTIKNQLAEAEKKKNKGKKEPTPDKEEPKKEETTSPETGSGN